MIWRAARLLLRLAGWLLTPVVILLAAASVAFVAALLVGGLPPGTALAVTTALGLIGGFVGLLLWMRLLRRHPELREALAVSPAGVPQEEAIEEILHPASTSEGKLP